MFYSKTNTKNKRKETPIDIPLIQRNITKQKRAIKINQILASQNEL